MLDWFKAHEQSIWAVVLASIGGLLGYLMRTVKNGRKVRAGQAALQMVSSGFVGYLVCHVGQALHIDASWMAPIIGVFGWVGAASSMLVLERMAMKKLGLTDTGERKASDG